jgi:EmrB/QacA subfamily drug resistance transporter
LEDLDFRKKLTIFLSIMSAMFFASLNQTIVGTALPQITASLGGASYFSWVFTVFMLASSMTAVLVGKLSDVYGRKPFILTGIGVFLVASFLNGTSHSMLELVAYRAVQGLGGGMIMSTAFTSVGDLFAPRERARWQGLMSLSFGTASLFGPTLGGYIVEHFDWHWVFWMFLPIGLVAFILILWLFPAPQRSPVRKRLDLEGALLLAATLLCFLLTFTFAGQPGKGLLAFALGVAAIVLLTFFLRAERRAVYPIVPPELFRNPVFRTSCLLNFLFGMSMFVNAMYTPLFMQKVMGATPSVSGLIWLSFTISMMAASTLTGQRVTKTGTYKRAAVIGFVLMSLAMVLMAFMDIHAPFAVLSANLMLFGTGIGIIFPLFMLTAQNAVGYENLGAATSCAQLFRQMGGTIGVSVMGLLTSSLQFIFSSVAVIALLSLFIVIYYLQEIPLLKRNAG